MFERIYVEKTSMQNSYTQAILQKFEQIPYTLIDSIDEYWGRVKKPYLQKRTNLNLFIGHKKGQLVKEAPDAYGISGEPHFYFVHAFNCIYECQYCYLQGYFNTPDMVFYVNHEEIISQMQQTLDRYPNDNVWFHAGEYSDSLALSHITKELPLYFEFFNKNLRAKLELRTKSVNIKELLQLSPLQNIYISFSISDASSIKALDLKTPSLKHRLKAIDKIAKVGYNIGIHFDPIVLNQEDILDNYQTLLEELFQVLPEEKFSYASLGVVRFTKDSYREVSLNYPNSPIFSENLIKSFDGKIRYPRPIRLKMLNSIKSMIEKRWNNAPIVYLCME